MKVFILEDDPIRVDYLINRLGQHDLTVAKSCTEVGKFQPPYDLILLDHDLGGRQMTEHEDDGTQFIQLIADRVNVDAVVIFHSYNPGGAQRMRNILGSGYIAPFRSGAFNRILLQVEEGRSEHN